MRCSTISFSFSFEGNRGFSIGIGDVTPGKDLITEKENLVDNGLVSAATKYVLSVFQEGGGGEILQFWI